MVRVRDFTDFKCQRCGRCCTEIINGAWIHIHGEPLKWWKRTPSLFYHPFYMHSINEIISAETCMRPNVSVDEVWDYLKSEEKRIEEATGYLVKFLWGGIIDQCFALKRDGALYSCLLHENYGGLRKPLDCTGWWPANNLEEAQKIGCKGIQALMGDAHS